MSEKRDKQRRQSSGRIRIAWVDQRGAYFQEKPTLIDYSDAGLCVLLNRRIEPRTMVGVRTMEHGHIGNAVVRNVIQTGLQYRIGLEFPSDIVNAAARF